MAVSIHAPVRGATLLCWADFRADYCFNPRARTGRDLHGAFVVQEVDVVSIHAPVRGATSVRLSPPTSALMFQSTRPYGARQAFCDKWVGVLEVSIHAPVRGATCCTICGISVLTIVSIHAPVRGATGCWNEVKGGCKCFNPRARTGRDGSLAEFPFACFEFQSTRPYGARRGRDLPSSPCFLVSIHAPVRGATYEAYLQAEKSTCFNPRARTGRDTSALIESVAGDNVSIHAPVRGATLSTDRIGCRRQRFNPRARTGRDDTQPLPGLGATCSFNPRARTGRDQPYLVELTGITQFQSTRPYGARLLTGQYFSCSGSCFNPRARTGRDFEDGCIHPCICRFNPRARTGRDRCGALRKQSPPEVSIHAPVRGATRRVYEMLLLGNSFNPRARTGRDGTCAK